MKRVLSLTIALCLLLAMLPAPAFATTTEETEPASRGSGEISAWVNPIYEDTLTPADLARSQELESPEQEPEQDDQTVKNEQELLTTSAYLSPDEAAVLMRQYLRERRETITMKIYYGASNQNVLLEEVFNKAVVHTGNPTEGDYLRWHSLGWTGFYDYTYDSQNSWYCFDFELQMTYLTTADQENVMNQAVANLLDTLNVGQGSEYQKIKAVYDYICSNVTYDYINLENPEYLLMYSAYAALINKTAVCQGYATLLYRLLLELGVDSRVIAGEVYTGEAHGWNIARIGQVYYNLDATLDAQADPDVCFLRNSVLDYTHYRYLEYESTEFHRNYPMSATDYQEGVEGVPEYIYVTGMCGDDVYWGIDRDGKLTISGTGATYDYLFTPNIEEASPFFYWSDGFNTVIVEEGITELGRALFYGADIFSVTLPESLVTIGIGAFRNQKNLKELHIPNGVKTIKQEAFLNSESLEILTLGDSLETIGFSAFSNCGLLKEVVFPDGLLTIEGSAFTNCDSLTEVTIPASVISASGFSDCENLETVYFYGKGVGQAAFHNCPKLHTVVLSDNVTTIVNSAFSRCDSLKEITIPASVEEMTACFGDCKNLETAYISASKIGSSAFSDCENLRNVILSDDVTSIELFAFYGCTSLTEFTFPASVTKLGDEFPGGKIFLGCSALSTLRFMGDLPWMAEDIFLDVTATAYYPMNNDTWTKEARQNYGGTLTWVIDCPDHNYQAATTEANCIQDGGTTYTCPTCQDTYVENFVHATGQHTYTDGADTDCDVCGSVRDLDMPTTPMYRLYNPNSGEHFYTGSLEEREMLIAAGWDYEGIAWNAPTNSGDPVHRLYNPNSGDHHYTMSVEERDMLVGYGWNYEGVCWNSATPDNLPLHRLYNPNAVCGSHHYTGSEEERDMLVNAGWIYEGIGWFGMLR